MEHWTHTLKAEPKDKRQVNTDCAKVGLLSIDDRRALIEALKAEVKAERKA